MRNMYKSGLITMVKDDFNQNRVCRIFIWPLISLNSKLNRFMKPKIVSGIIVSYIGKFLVFFVNFAHIIPIW